MASNDSDKAKISSITHTKDWSQDQLDAHLEEMKLLLGWKNTTGSAQKWWNNIESKYQDKKESVIRLAEEIAMRNSTITEFFLAYVYSNTDNISEILQYMDETKVEKQAENSH